MTRAHERERCRPFADAGSYALQRARAHVADREDVRDRGAVVDVAADLRIKGARPKFVGRGGLKLEAALDVLHAERIDHGIRAMDVAKRLQKFCTLYGNFHGNPAPAPSKRT